MLSNESVETCALSAGRKGVAPARSRSPVKMTADTAIRTRNMICCRRVYTIWDEWVCVKDDDALMRRMRRWSVRSWSGSGVWGLGVDARK